MNRDLLLYVCFAGGLALCADGAVAVARGSSGSLVEVAFGLVMTLFGAAVIAAEERVRAGRETPVLAWVIAALFCALGLVFIAEAVRIEAPIVIRVVEGVAGAVVLRFGAYGMWLLHRAREEPPSPEGSR